MFGSVFLLTQFFQTAQGYSPLDAGLGWTVDLQSPRDFVGKTALVAHPATRQLTGLLLLEAGGVLRAHQKVATARGEGEVTSGSFSPTLERSIGLARVPVQTADRCEVEIRGRLLEAAVVRTPFVRNGKIAIPL